MVTIKLMPFGRKHLKHFRIVIVESREKLTSNPTAVLGYYQVKEKNLVVDREAVDVWIKKGAQPSDSVRKLLGL